MNDDDKQAMDEDVQTAIEEVMASLEGNEGSIPHTMTFVSGGSFNPGYGQESTLDNTNAGKEIEYTIAAYKPPTQEEKNHLNASNLQDVTSQEKDTTRQIDTLMEEFKKNQDARDRMKLEREAKSTNQKNEVASVSMMASAAATTNLRLGNLLMHVTPDLLATEFSCYGPVLTSKVMIPRNESGMGATSKRSATCGFVLFAHRADAERAKFERDGTMFHGSIISVDWAAAPDPQSLARMMRDYFGSLHVSGSSSSLLRHSTQPHANTRSSMHHSIPKGAEIVYVIEPNPQMKRLIDEFAHSVLISGPHLEHELIQQQHQQNPHFAFITVHTSSEYLYYKWRLESLRKGESLTRWNDKKPLKVGTNETYFIPPAMNARPTPFEGTESASSYLSPMDFIPRHIAEQGDLLPSSDREQLEFSLREITPSRSRIREVMEWAMDRETHAPEIVQVLTESLIINDTKLITKLARLFLVSDILHNVSKMMQIAPTEFPKLYLFNAAFYSTLPLIMKSFAMKLKSIPGRISAQALKDQVHKVIHGWRKPAIYMPSFLDSLLHTFNGTEPPPPPIALSATTSLLSSTNPHTSNKSTVASDRTTSSSASSALRGSGAIDGVDVVEFNGRPIDFDALIEEEIGRLRHRIRGGHQEATLPETLIKKLKS